MGYIDSASYYYNELLKCGTIYAKQTAHKGLAKIAILHDNPQKALLHLNQYIQYTDFIHQITDTENVRRLNSLYNYQLREKENNRLKIENKEKQNLIIYIISIGLFIIASLFAYLQRNKRKKQLLKIQLKNLRQLKEEQYKKSSLFIEENKRKIEELEQKLQEADQTNHILRTQLKEQIELTLYTNKQAEIELTRRKQSNSTLLESEIYKYIQKQLTTKTNKKLLSNNDWKELEKVINNTYEGFSKNLRNYYDLNEHEYSVCLLIKINIPPIDIAKLTNHSKEAITSTRRRLYEKVFGKKGSPKDWDEFILSL